MKENLLVVESMIKQDVYTHKNAANNIAKNPALRRGNNTFLVNNYQSSHRGALADIPTDFTVPQEQI